MVMRTIARECRMSLFIVTCASILGGVVPARGEAADTVATVGTSYAFTFLDVAQYFNDHRYNLIYRDKLRGLTRSLDEMIDQQVKVQDFFAQGFAGRRELLEGIRRTINEELTVRYFQSTFYEPMVGDSAARMVYEGSGHEVVAQQIRVPLPDPSTPAQRDSVKAFALKLQQEIAHGANPLSLVHQHGLGMISATGADGSRVITWKEGAGNKLDETIFRALGGEVLLLESNKAWYVVKILAVHPVSLPPFASLHNEIIKILDLRYRNKAFDDFEAMKNHLLDERSVRWNDSAFAQLLSWSNTANFYERGFADTLQKSIAAGRNPILMESPALTVDFKEYRRILLEDLVPKRSRNFTDSTLKVFILEAVRTSLVVRKAVEAGLEPSVVNVNTTNPIIRNELAWLYDRLMVEEKLPPPTEDALRDFYDEHRDSLFFQFEKVNIYTLITPRRDSALIFVRKMKEGTPIEKITGEVLVKTFIRNKEGKIVSYLSGEPPYLGEAAFALQAGDTAGPVAYVDSTGETLYAVMKCIRHIQPKQLSYDDVQGTIREQFADANRRRMSADLIRELREKYSVIVHMDTLERDLAATARPGK